MNSGAQLHYDARRPGRKSRTFSASVTLDGLVTLNHAAPRAEKEAANNGVNGKLPNDFRSNGHGAFNGNQLYRANGVKQNDVKGIHRNLSNQRNITSEWRKSVKKTNPSNHSGSTQSSNSSERSSPQTGQATRGRSIEAKATTDIKELSSPPTKSTAAKHSGHRSPISRSEVFIEQVKTDPNPTIRTLVKIEPTTATAPIKPNSLQNDPTSADSATEDMTTSIPVKSPPTTTDSVPTKPASQQNVPQIGGSATTDLTTGIQIKTKSTSSGVASKPTSPQHELATGDSATTYSQSVDSIDLSITSGVASKPTSPQHELATGDSSTTDSQSVESIDLSMTSLVAAKPTSPQNGPTTGDSASVESIDHISISHRTKTSRPKSDHSPTRRTGNRTPTGKPKGFCTPVQMSNLLVVNQMNSDNDPSESNHDDDDLRILQNADGLKNSHSGSGDSMSTRRSSMGGSQRSFSFLVTTPSIPEEKAVIKPDKAFMNSSNMSVISDAESKVSRMSRMTIDPRITSDRRASFRMTREVNSFYEPTTNLEDAKRTMLINPSVIQASLVGGRKLPKPYKFKSKKQKAKEKRKLEKQEAKRRAIRARRYAEAEDMQPLSVSFPILTRPQDVFIHSRGKMGAGRTEVMITTEDPEDLVATLSYTELLPSDKGRRLASGRRVLRDAAGNQCALILHSRSIEGRNTFRICGPVPMNSLHKSVEGYFVWAEVKNIGELSSQFCMTLKRDADPQGQSIRFKTKNVGSNLLSCIGSEAHGFSIYRKKEDGTKTEGCAKISYYHASRGLTVSPNLDLGLMLCYALVIDEMVSNRLR